jgi:hypothetical protein
MNNVMQMNKRLIFIILIVIASGSVVTLTSGLYSQDLSQGLGVSITGYGFPLSWYKRVIIIIPSEPITYEFSLGYFMLDFLFWSLITYMIVSVIVYKRNHTLGFTKPRVRT